MSKPYIHKNLADGRWFELTLAEQLGNLGSEYHRASLAKKQKSAERYDLAAESAMELCELTVADPKWLNTSKLKELCRMKSEVARTLYVDKQPDRGLQNYFDGFAMMARKDR